MESTFKMGSTRCEATKNVKNILSNLQLRHLAPLGKPDLEKKLIRLEVALALVDINICSCAHEANTCFSPYVPHM